MQAVRAQAVAASIGRMAKAEALGIDRRARAGGPVFGPEDTAVFEPQWCERQGRGGGGGGIRLDYDDAVEAYEDDGTMD